MKINKLKINTKLFISFLLISAYVTLNAQVTTTIPSPPNGEWKVTTKGNRIDIEFKPDKDSVNCTKIGFVQTVKLTFYDAAGNVVPLAPSAIDPRWTYRDKDTIPGGAFIDHTFCEKDPAYNGDDIPQDHAAGGATGQGSSAGNGTATTASTMNDSPRIPDGSFPPGTKSVVMEFETCAICMGGTDAGTNYGCITWKYENTDGDADPKGKSVLFPVPPAVAPPSAGFIAALAKFASTHTTTGTDSICPEELPAGACGNRVSGKDGPLLFHINSSYKVEKAEKGAKKGNLPPDGVPGAGNTGFPSTPLPSGSTIDSCTYVYVPPGEKIEIKRLNLSNPINIIDPTVPFAGTFTDHLQGNIEITESGVCFQGAHCGIKAQTCALIPLAAAAPLQSTNPTGIIMFTGRIDNLNDLVIFKNDALSTAPIQCVNLFNNVNTLLPDPIIILFPGDSMVYAYPGMITDCTLPYQPTVSLTPTNSTCSDGTITSSVTGGLPPYTYQWSNGATTANLNGLPPGVYTTTITDEHLFTATASANISGPVPLMLTIDSVKNATCPGGHDGYMSFHASGGAGAYNYSVERISPVTCCVSNDCGINPDFTCSNCSCTSSSAGPYANLADALYVLTVTDAFGCSATATVSTAPAALTCGPISGSPTLLCASGAGTGSYSVPITANVIYFWSVPLGMTISSGQGTNSIAVQWSAASANSGIKGNVSVTASQSGCTTPAPTTCNLFVDINVVKPVQPNSISGPAKVCPGDLVSYSIASVSRASSYNWSLPAGMLMMNGAGSNLISVSVGAGYTGGVLSVSASNACGTGNARSKNLSLNTPFTPGTISGPLNGVCGGASVLYTIAPVSNATSYHWTVSGGTDFGPDGGTSFYFRPAFFDVFYDLTVVSQNGCGNSSTRSLTVNGKPAFPSPISGPLNVCTNSTGIVYSVPTVTGTTYYDWTVPTIATITSGVGSKTITVDYGNIPASAQVLKVQATNACGSSAIRSLNNITLSDCPRSASNAIETGFMAFPNPAKDELNVQFNLLDGEKYQLQLLDLLGRQVIEENGNSTGEIVHYKFDTDQFPNGVYELRLITKKTVSQLKVILE